MDDKAAEKAFLAELEALEKFRVSYTGLYPSVPLAREDPDVRRLIEAMAFFSARTRSAAVRTVNESLVRLFHQHFPYALSPLPAMTTLRAETSARHVDTVELPRGLEVLVERKGPGGAPTPYQFRSLAPMRILPIELVGVELLARPRDGHRILLRFASGFPRNDEIGTLSLHIDHLNDALASMGVLHALRSHLRRASVLFDKDVRDDAQGQPCEVSFGAIAPPAHEREAYENTVQRFRSFLQFPEGELFVHVQGIKPPRNWQEFAVCFDVRESWPLELRLTPDTFALHVVPMVNIRRDMANPIECDGTKERYPVRHPDTAAGFVPHSVLGAYTLTDNGMVPLEPGVLGPTKQGYEIAFEGQGAARRAWALLDLPSAFEQPERVSIEAFWTQPGIKDVPPGMLRARLGDRHVEGLSFSCGAALSPPVESDIVEDRDALLAMMALKSQRFLGLDDLTFLVRALGASQRPEFARLTSALRKVGLSSRPAGRRAGGVCFVYDLEFDNLDGSDLPALDLFCGKLLGLLESWSIEQVVEITSRVPRLDHKKTYAE